ncbi:MAG: MoxR family ATPase [Blastocatellia bacterium]|nr:MoxR family ATPase [Blastocatellia bacterium]
MSQTDWKVYQGLESSGETEAKVPSQPHDGIEQLLENDEQYCPPWRNFRARYEAFLKTHGVAPEFPQLAPEEPDGRGDMFLPTEKMIEMVNVALHLRRPLLVTGKPGTGKSTLIYSVARELKLGKVLRWPITSRSSLSRGLYEYDAIGRLQDWQLKYLRSQQAGQNPPFQPSDLTDEATDIGEYLRLGPLGTAMYPWSRPRALLIDEIDKGDADLPNDLLNVFEEGNFEIPELVRLRKSQNNVKVRPADSEIPVTITAGQVQCLHFPLVVMTSNNERDFPAAFLRRCVPLEIPEPKKEELWRIVKSHLGPKVESEAKPIIEDFLKRVEQGKKQLATDQLLGAIYLMSRDRAPSHAEREGVINSIFKPLTK